MWRLGSLLIFLFTSGQVIPDEAPAALDKRMFGDGNMNWYCLCFLLTLQREEHRLPPNRLLDHPTFWASNHARVSLFWSNVFEQYVPFNLMASVTSSARELFFPYSAWTEPLGCYHASGGDLFPLIKAICQKEPNGRDEAVEVLARYCQQTQSDPLYFVQSSFPCLLSKVWEILFYQLYSIEFDKKSMETIFRV
jgi:hypothetical protein